MKIGSDIIFGHPVLQNHTEDYPGGKIVSEFTIELVKENLIIYPTINIGCNALLDLVDNGFAGAGFYLVCQDTFDIRLEEVSLPSQPKSVQVSKFFGTVLVRAVVWSKRLIPNWKSEALNKEYDAQIDIPPHSLLAIGEEFRFSVDRLLLKPFESIFEFAESKEIPVGQFKVDTESQKITILAHPLTKSNVEEIRNASAGRDVLLNSVYLPAVMEVLVRIQQSDVDLSTYSWFRVFSAKCAHLGIDPANVPPFEGAQALLLSPFKAIESERENIFT